MTPKQLEVAARELCRLRGINPAIEPRGTDEWITRSASGALVDSSILARAKVEIEAALHMQQAIESGRAVRELVPLQEFNVERAAKRHAQDDAIGKPRPNGIACPTCGKELIDSQPLMTLSSHPPQKHVQCTACGFAGTRFA